MAFSDKTIDAFKDAIATAHADDASCFTFIMKHSGKDVVVLGNGTTPEMLCAVAAFVTHCAEDRGTTTDKILKLVKRGLKGAPITKGHEERIEL